MMYKSLRSVAMVNHAVVWLSALIVTGIGGWFLNKYSHRNTHLIYEEVIAVLTFVIWTVGMFLPLVKKYYGHLLPLNLAMSYLWLTSFIFSTQDWSDGRCTLIGPSYGHCGLKRTIAAFNFFAFFFLLCNVLIEGYLWHTHDASGVERTHFGKSRPVAHGDGIAAHNGGISSV